MPKLSIVIPVFNEFEVIPTLYKRCIEATEKWCDDFEVIVVNDGSTDNSQALLDKYHAQDSRWKTISLSRNFGHQAAFLAGLNYASGDYIAMIDGDLQDPPELLESFYLKLNEGYDVVYGIRKKRKESFIKKLFYSAYYKILHNFSDIDIPVDSGDFSMLRRNVLDHILTMQEHSLFIRGLRSWVGFRQYGYEYERDSRLAGEVKYTIRKLFKLAYNGFFSFSEFPIKLLTYLGVIIMGISICYTIYALIAKVLFPDTPQGFTTLAISIFMLSGVQLISIGIVGEYVVRIYNETRKRPLFIVVKKDF